MEMEQRKGIVGKNKRLKARKKGLYINQAKTKYMEWANKEFVQGQYLTMTMENTTTYRFKQVERFEYLETVFIYKPGAESEFTLLATAEVKVIVNNDFQG